MDERTRKREKRKMWCTVGLLNANIFVDVIKCFIERNHPLEKLPKSAALFLFKSALPRTRCTAESQVR